MMTLAEISGETATALNGTGYGSDRRPLEPGIHEVHQTWKPLVALGAFPACA
jgi:hypothetical protein